MVFWTCVTYLIYRDFVFFRRVFEFGLAILEVWIGKLFIDPIRYIYFYYKMTIQWTLKKKKKISDREMFPNILHGEMYMMTKWVPHGQK